MWREHNYYVSSKESAEFLLVHNSCPFPKDKKALADLLGIAEDKVHDWVKKKINKFKSQFPYWVGDNPDVGSGPNGRIGFKVTKPGPHKGKIWEHPTVNFVDEIE
ncbi:MAG: hypothetical protein IPO14_06295 [Saprospiraceae bacterium]|nr:hypothetical protein [Saprospiraceae bacterium]